MIDEFLLSWELFRDTYLAGWSIAVALSIVGCLVIVRGQVFLVLAVLSAVVVFCLRRQLLLVAIDPEMAAAVGLGVRRWTLGLSLWLGLVIGLSIRVSGLLFTFGCLVLPPLAAKSPCREVTKMFLVAPLIGFALSVVGFVLANDLDLPPAQMTVALLSGAVVVVWGYRRWQPR